MTKLIQNNIELLIILNKEKMECNFGNSLLKVLVDTDIINNL